MSHLGRVGRTGRDGDGHRPARRDVVSEVVAVGLPFAEQMPEKLTEKFAVWACVLSGAELLSQTAIL